MLARARQGSDPKKQIAPNMTASSLNVHRPMGIILGIRNKKALNQQHMKP